MKKKDIAEYLDLHGNEIFSVAQEVYDNPEVSKEEAMAAKKFKKLLSENGFTIHELEVDGLDHAFYGEFGCGHPVVALLGEYDALPGLSQEGGCKERKAIKEGAPGHACGHNLIARGHLAVRLEQSTISNKAACQAQ
ncbi:MAG: hypothetical protein PHI41_08470 [Erysipelotrichaceae bacterium]|nr:hypothetical protein [Erysipelotrichaceae bacterium]MDD3810521.1 hypothetical protein [Erysipelotrichaceae bacterium]